MKYSVSKYVFIVTCFAMTTTMYPSLASNRAYFKKNKYIEHTEKKNTNNVQPHQSYQAAMEGKPTCTQCTVETPRADALRTEAIPYFFTFETGGRESGKQLVPMHTKYDKTPYMQGVVPFYGKLDPAGGKDAVTRMIRPKDGIFGGYEDFKFQPLAKPINFSQYHKWTISVFIPGNQDFSGKLAPQVDLMFHDSNAKFWERWTLISKTISKADLGKWVTLQFDGTKAKAAGSGVLLPQQTTYNQISLRFGGSNHKLKGVFYVKDFKPVKIIPTTAQPITNLKPRASVLNDKGLPYFFTFEADDASSGLKLLPRTSNPNGNDYKQAVKVTYGVPDPAGSLETVGKFVRPKNGSFGGFEDFKFQFWSEKIDFSTYHKYKISIYIPSSNDFSGALKPQIDLLFHDNNKKFWERWTRISHTVTESDFDKWITLEFDGSKAKAAGTGILLPNQKSYDNITIRLGGAGHLEEGTFYIKDFMPVK